MNIGEVAAGCQEAIDTVAEGVRRVKDAHVAFAIAKARLAEVLSEGSAHFGAVVGPYSRVEESLIRSISQALAAIEDLGTYTAFILGTGDLGKTGEATSTLSGTTPGTTSRPSASGADAPSLGGTLPTRPSRVPDRERLPGGIVSRVREARAEGDGIRRENSAAIVLARHGYDVIQNPPPRANRREPDYLIEGEYWDCLSPQTTNGGQIRKRMSEKVRKDQADRIILNLDRDDHQPVADIDEIRQSLHRRPIAGLTEIKIIHNGQVIDFYPW